MGCAPEVDAEADVPASPPEWLADSVDASGTGRWVGTADALVDAVGAGTEEGGMSDAAAATTGRLELTMATAAVVITSSAPTPSATMPALDRRGGGPVPRLTLWSH